MFDRQFEQLFRALHRIEQQLSTASHEEKEILREEIIALRAVCDRFVEKWLTFEEKVVYLSELFGLEIDLEELPKKPVKPNPVMQPVHVKAIPLPPPAEEEQIVRSFQKGVGYFDLLMFPDAIRELERVVALDGQFTVARLYLAFGYLAKEEYDKAAQQLNLVAAGVKEPFILAMVHNSFGHIYAAKKDYARAAEEFKQTAEYMQDFRDAYYNLGVCQYNQKLYRDALASFLVALDQDPKDWHAERIVSSIWRKIGSPEKAYQHIEQAYRLNSSDYDILMEFADLCLQQQEFDLARSLYKRASRFYPTAVQPLGGLGWLAVREGNTPEAISCFKKQLTLAPNDRQAQFNFGWALLLEGDSGKADQIFQKLMEFEPDWIHTRIGAARVALEQGNYHMALEQSAEALKLDENSKELWFYKGLAHSGLGDREQAQQCWNRCRELLTVTTEARGESS
ncbi:tetratricopeptide repeat protein [Effusibacillus consociatus]